jgi:hypothetical protein
MSFINAAVKTSSMTYTILLHPNWYLIVASVAHAVDYELVFTFSGLAALIAAIVTVVSWYWCHRIIPHCNHLYR